VAVASLQNRQDIDLRLTSDVGGRSGCHEEAADPGLRRCGAAAWQPRCCSASGAYHSRPPRGRPSLGCHRRSAPMLSAFSKSCSGGGTPRVSCILSFRYPGQLPPPRHHGTADLARRPVPGQCCSGTWPRLEHAHGRIDHRVVERVRASPRMCAQDKVTRRRAPPERRHPPRPRLLGGRSCRASPRRVVRPAPG
jgi:hypothetical protein